MDKQCFLKQCIQGFSKFKSNIDDTLLEQLRYSQDPDALIISCSDSRVDPALLFSCSPGDIFVVRNIANIVPPYQDNILSNELHGVSAAIEYAVLYLQVQHIVLLGHSNCGGINALFTPPQGSFITPWISLLTPAKEKVEKKYSHLSFEQQKRCCEMEAMEISYNNLKTFPCINHKLLAKELQLHTWYFNLETASLAHLDMEKGESPIIIKHI